MAPHIPSELLDLVLNYLLTSPDPTDRDAFLSALCICETWSDIGQRLLWTDMALNSPRKMLRFASAPSSESLSIIKSLTIRIDNYEHGIPFEEAQLLTTRRRLRKEGSEKTQKLHQALRLLPSKLELMKNLSTFSLYVTPYMRDKEPLGFFLLRRQLYGVVRSLPQQLKDLEIDSKCREQRQIDDDEYHICPLIAARLQQLEHLRVRLRRMCGAMLAPSPHIKTVMISNMGARRRPCTMLCGSLECESTTQTPALYNASEYDRHMAAQIRVEIVMSAKDMAAESPKLSRLQFLDIYHDTSLETERTETLDSVSVFDIIKKRTMQYPMGYVDQGQGQIDLREDRICLRYIKEQGQEMDQVGSISVLEEFIEGPAWLSTASGMRFPASLKDLPEGRRHNWDVSSPSWTQEDWETEHPELEVDLWKLEKEAEQKLFLIKDTAGVDELRIMKAEARLRPLKRDDDDVAWMGDLEGVPDEELAEGDEDFEE